MTQCSPLRSLLAVAALLLAADATAGRPLVADDWYRFANVSDLQVAPDGASLAYLVTRYDREADASRASLWTVNWSGGEPRALTQGESVSDPRYSPDGRYLSFLSARPADGPTRLWLLERAGGEAREAGRVSGDIVGYEWSPDAAHVVLVVRSPGSNAEAEAKKPHPIVIDSLQFKQDGIGYLAAGVRTHLVLLDTRDGTEVALTTDATRNDTAPAFSPDGKRIAYASARVDDPTAVARDDIELIEAHAGATPQRVLTTTTPNHQALSWSPDGARLSYLVGDEPRWSAYIADRPAVVELTSGRERRLAAGLDRAVYSLHFASDGRSLLGTIEDDGYQVPAAIDPESGAVTRLGERIVAHELVEAHGRVAVIASSDRAPAEVHALEHGQLRALSAHNAALFAELTLGTVEDIHFKSRDGTDVHGQLVKPVGFVPGRRYPTVVWIHGGPNGQDDHSLQLAGYSPPLERQLFATHGYLVLAINYRGGSGRGQAFARAIAGDWGHLEVEDLLGGVDFAVANGLADPARLGIGGWSYGGILTDYAIATTTRFRAAISGAGSANQTGMYGVDQYVHQYDAELGPPWKDTARWLRVSYPFFHADRIRTPTLFMGGDRDFNVPVAGGEQMYEALRTQGVATALVVYPGEFHVLTRPSFLVDRWQRFLGWMDDHLGPAP